MAENWIEMVKKQQLGWAGQGGCFATDSLVSYIVVSLDRIDRNKNYALKSRCFIATICYNFVLYNYFVL